MLPIANALNPSSAIEKFDEWNEEKKFLHDTVPKKKSIHPREIWYVKLGQNIGNEENGKKEFRRPVLVVKRIGNMYFCMPLTTKWKIDSLFYIRIKTARYFINSKEDSFVLVSQWKVFDKKRFMDQIGSIESEEFWEIKKSLKAVYF